MRKIGFEDFISRTISEGKYKSDHPTSGGQNIQGKGELSNIQLESDKEIHDGDEYDWCCDIDDLELQYNVWDFPKRNKIIYYFLFNDK